MAMAEHADIRAAAAAVVSASTAAGKTVATAESCTGGWIAKALTDVPGSSAVLGYGIVSYSNAAKQSLLDVATASLAADGAVSEAVVREMADAALARAGADVAVAVSGIAGPDGGTPDKPVGTVWFAWARMSDGAATIDAELQRFDGDREQVRRQTVVHALNGILERMHD